MKRIRKSRATRILSWLLTVAMIVPLLAGTVAPRAASAQQGAPATSGGVQTVIVIDFANTSGFGGDALARFATDAVAVELASSARFEVLKRDEVTRAAEQLGLRAPYDTIALTKIATQLGATGIVTGEVAKVLVDNKTSPKTVSVGMRVSILESGSGDIVNGSAQVGVAKAKPGESDDASLAQDAVRNAATMAVRDILQYNLPEGIVLYTVGSTAVQVLINRGSRDGVKAGMEMLVLRDRQRVGKIRVTTVYPTDSEAAIVENTLGIRPEDRVRAVFPMPELVMSAAGIHAKRPGSGRNASMRSLTAIAAVLVLGIVLAEAARGKQQTVTGVVAEAELVGNTPAVRVTWRDSMWGQGASILEYHIWRVPDAPYNLAGTPVAAIAGGGQTQYNDLAGTTGFWNGTYTFLRPPLPDPTGQNNDTSETVTPAAGEVPGPTPGTSYIYSVSSVIRTTTTGTGTGGTGGTTNIKDLESTPVASGQATPLQQPLLTSPVDQQGNVNVGALNFTWSSVRGADEFVVEVTTLANRDFRNRSLIHQFPIVLSTAPFATGVPQTMPAPINLASPTLTELRRDPSFLAWVTGAPGATVPTLVWRVGARNSKDRPGPVSWISNNPRDSDRTFRWIYSQPSTFAPAVLPPPPP